MLQYITLFVVTNLCLYTINVNRKYGFIKIIIVRELNKLLPAFCVNSVLYRILYPLHLEALQIFMYFQQHYSQ